MLRETTRAHTHVSCTAGRTAVGGLQLALRFTLVLALVQAVKRLSGVDGEQAAKQSQCGEHLRDRDLPERTYYLRKLEFLG